MRSNIFQDEELSLGLSKNLCASRSNIEINHKTKRVLDPENEMDIGYPLELSK